MLEHNMIKILEFVIMWCVENMIKKLPMVLLRRVDRQM